MRRPFSIFRIVSLLLCLAAVFVLTGLKVRQNIEWNRLPAIQQQAYLVQAVASNSFYRSLHHLMRAGMTRAEIEAVVNGGKPIPTHPYLATDGEGHNQWLEVGRIRDLKTGGEVHISFVPDGTAWRDYGPIDPVIALPPPTPLWVSGEELRTQVLTFAPPIWWLSLLAWPFVRRHVQPPRAGKFLLIIALMWLAAELLSPYFSPGFHTVKFLFWPFIAASGSVIILALSSRESPDHTLCVHCSYSLIGNVSGICPECGNAIVSADGLFAAAIPSTSAQAKRRTDVPGYL